MSFCRATRTYFNASEGIEATNQFGEKHLYSPYASFFYCVDCGKRLVTEKITVDKNDFINLLPWITSEEEANKTNQIIIKQIKDMNLIRKEARKVINTLVKENIIKIEERRNYEAASRASHRVYENFANKLKIYNDRQTIYQIIKLTDKDFSNEIRNLKKRLKTKYITPIDNRIDQNGEGLCKEHEDDYTKCQDCGKWTKKDLIHSIILAEDLSTKIDICEECFEDHYVQCNECEGWINSDTTHYDVIDDDIYCCECRNENFTQCEGCGEWIRNDNILETDDNYFFCEYCWSDNTTECHECGRVFHENIEYDEDDEEYYCRHCRGEGSNVILNYSYKPIPLKHCANGEKELFGMEIEVEGNKGKAKSFLEQFGDTEKKDIYLKNDGSVCGFEIVTQPMSRKYFYREFVPKLEKGMKYLRNNGFKGHNRAGIHIHVSTEAINEDMLKKMMILMYSKQKRTYELWLKITQRKDSQMSQWSSMSPDSLLNCDKKYVAKELDRNKNAKRRKKPDLSSSRYTAINCRNTDTIEFRIFNSNIRTERIIKNAQVVFALIDFTKTDRLPTMNNYLKFIQKNSEVYKELYEFLVEKEIIQPKEKAEKIDELMEVMNVKSIEGLKKELTSIQMKRLKPTSLSELNSEDDERNIQCA